MTQGRTSVLIYTPDSQSARFRECYDSVMDTTQGETYDLRIVDNRHWKDFSQQKEINRLLQYAPGPVINLDDDVIVQGNWYRALHDAADDDTGIVTANVNGRAVITEPACVPIIGLCCTLINVQVWRDGRPYIYPHYQKYFFDWDFGLYTWEEGLKCKVIPDTIIHNSGGGMRDEGRDRDGPHKRDRQLFRERWILNHEYDRLYRKYSNVWKSTIRSDIYDA